MPAATAFVALLLFLIRSTAGRKVAGRKDVLSYVTECPTPAPPSFFGIPFFPDSDARQVTRHDATPLKAKVEQFVIESGQRHALIGLLCPAPQPSGTL